MERTLVKQGVTTLMVSLPRSWVREQNLQKGSPVDVRVNGADVVISVDGANRKKTISLSLRGCEESLIRTMITNTYRVGVDYVTVIFSSKEQYEILQDVVKTKLLGFQITKKDSGSCTIESVTEPDSDQFDNILSKFFLSVGQLITLLEERTQKNTISDDVDELEERIMQYENFCLRCLSKNARSSNVDFLQQFIRQISHAQRSCYLAFDHVLASDAKDVSLCAQILQILRDSYAKLKLDDIDAIHTIAKRYEKNFPAKILKGNHLIREAVRRFYQANSPLVGYIMLENNKLNY